MTASDATSTAPERRPARSHALGVGALLIATLAVFGDVVAGGQRIPSAHDQDMASIFFYWYELAFRELRHGNLMLWNPFSFAGAPFLGGFQPALLYPPNWLHLILPTTWAINIGIVLHFFVSGVGTYLWAAHRGLSTAASVLAGIVFMYCGAHVLHLYSGHVPHLCSLAWAPFVFLAVDHAFDDGSVAWMLLGMAAVALQILAGNIQYVHYTAMVAALYAAAMLVRSERRLRTAATLAAFAIGGAALAAVQLLAAVDAVRESLRAGLSYGLAASFPFPPENLLTLAFPDLFGDMLQTPYWGRWALHEASVFVGAAAVLFAIYGAVAGERRRRRFSIAMTLICLLVAFGEYTPLFRVLYDYLPGFQSVRVVARVTFLASLFIALLAGIGYDRLRVRPAPGWLVAFALTVAIVAGGAGAALARDCRAGGQDLWLPGLQSLRGFFSDAYELFVVDRAPQSAVACANAGRSLLTGGGTFLGLAVLLWMARRRRALVHVVAVIAVVELGLEARAMRPTFDPAPLVARTAAMRQRMSETGRPDARVMSEVPYFYLPMSAGVLDVWAGADLVLGRYARFIALTQQWPVDAILVSAALRKPSPLLGMLRLEYHVRVDGDDVRLVPTNIPPMPRAALMTRWRVLSSSAQVLEAMQDRSFDPARVVLLEDDPEMTPGNGDDAGVVSVRDVSTDELEVTADVRAPAVLLITDNYSAGWRAVAAPDSAAASYRVVPADYTFRAVPLAPGTHHFRLEYRPIGYVVGAWVSAVALLLYGAAWVRWWRRCG